jgi:hypothetical protein
MRTTLDPIPTDALPSDLAFPAVASMDCGTGATNLAMEMESFPMQV